MSNLKLAATPAELAKLKRDATRAGHASLAAYLRSLTGLAPRQVGGKREGAGGRHCFLPEVSMAPILMAGR